MKWKDGVITQLTVIKNGVEVVIKPSVEIITAWTIADQVSKKLTSKPVTITSVLDGKHKEDSKHYDGDAFDMRTFIYTVKEINALAPALREALGPDYDVVLEADHIHIEFDPKN